MNSTEDHITVKLEPIDEDELRQTRKLLNKTIRTKW